MKLWIDEQIPAPDGYRWNKNLSEAICTMQETDLTIDRAIRNKLLVPNSVGGPMSLNEMRVSEISVSAEFAKSRSCDALRHYLEELGQSEFCKITIR